jgi:hypothetical protein
MLCKILFSLALEFSMCIVASCDKSIGMINLHGKTMFGKKKYGRSSVLVRALFAGRKRSDQKTGIRNMDVPAGPDIKHRQAILCHPDAYNF